MIDTQRHTQPTNLKNQGLFGYLLLLTIFFMLLEVSVLIQGSNIYLGEYKFIADHLTLPVKILPGIFYYVFVQFALHFFFTVIIWGITRFIGHIFKLSWHTIFKLGFVLWIFGIITLLLANGYSFPNSKFADLILISPNIVKILLLISMFIWSVVLLITCVSFISLNPNIALAIVGISLTWLLGHQTQKSVVDAATKTKPNIILIGIDSLRPDFLGFFGYEKVTPNLDKFLNNATVFSDAFSPLARTFPAWVSILSGEYPKKSGVRFNLPASITFNLQNTLPNILRQAGYQTLFATDETRFSNIDQRFGFDKVMTPPVGVNDFLLGNLNDFPMANLLVNTPIGQYLFPNSYGNRPAFITYDPNSFIQFLKPTLSAARQKPLFLAVHFCLPHYPYFWGRFSADDKSIRNYQASIERVDQQFNDFFTLLKQDKLLEHSIVIVLSDHGEAIELPGDRVTNQDLYIPNRGNSKGTIPHFYPPAAENEAVDKTTGHGTDVLGLTQYHVVLAMRTFGLEKNKSGIVPGRVSLLDIKPTILDFLNSKKIASDDGSSLKNAVYNNAVNTNPNTHFFIESDFSPQAVRSVHPETSKLLFEGIDYFQIDPITARISVKESMAKLIISSKQYADIYNGWILALYPQQGEKMMPILVNLTTGEWTNDLRIPFAKHSPADSMLLALKNFYKEDLTFILNK